MQLIDTGCDWLIRIVKTGESAYVSQVWGARLYRVLGTFPTRHAARQAAHAFVATDPVEPDQPDRPSEGWQRRRSDSHAPLYKWVRKVKGLNTWQARPWLGPKGKSLNLGLFTFEEHGDDAEWKAAQVAKAFGKAWKPGVTVAEAVATLKAAGLLRADLAVPCRQRNLKPPKAGRDPETAVERRERERREWLRRERRRYAGGTLVDVA